MVESFVDDRRVLRALREVVAVEVCEPTGARIGDIDVTHSTAREVGDLLPILLHPGAKPEVAFGSNGHNGDVV